MEDTKPSEVDESSRWSENQTETPKPKSPTPDTKKQKPDNNGVTSLSYDEVNDNPDELIELRGEGRYFGITDPENGTTINAQQSLGPLCDNCHKRGHVRSKCKTVICHKCGVVGDHYETQCPTTMICAKCGQRGHMVYACTNKTKKREYCKHCDTFSHSNYTCPSIWRSYITKPQSGNQDTRLPVIYCYNCGDDSHFGDECHRPRSSRIPNINGSAFSGTNLPKHLRNTYNNASYDRSRSGRSDYGSNARYSNGYNFNSKPQRPLKPSKKDYNGSTPMQPTRSGLMQQRKNGLPPIPQKANRSGVLPKPQKGRNQQQNNRTSSVKPNRSGMLPKNGNRKNYQAFY